MQVHEEWADVIFFQGFALHHFLTLQRSNKIMVVDLYDPMHLEQLEQGREMGDAAGGTRCSSTTEVVNEQLAARRLLPLRLRAAAALLARPARGSSAASTRTPTPSRREPRDAHRIAPFGMDTTPPQHTRKAIRGVGPGHRRGRQGRHLGRRHLQLVRHPDPRRAIAQVAERHDDIRLFFLGVAHPNPDVPEMAIVAKTREHQRRSLGLTGKHVFFNEHWVALDDRQNYLLEADAGVSARTSRTSRRPSRSAPASSTTCGRTCRSSPPRATASATWSPPRAWASPCRERDVDALAAALESMLYDRRRHCRRP